MRGTIVVGLDLSLRGAAACALPPDWSPLKPFARVTTRLTGYQLTKQATAQEVVERHAEISRDINGFIASTYEANTDLAVFVEDYAFGLAKFGGLALAEMTGVVKANIFREHGVAATPLNQLAIRKFFLGKLPKKDVGTAVQVKLAEMGSPWKTSDQGDAFVVANYGRSELGLPAVSFG